MALPAILLYVAAAAGGAVLYNAYEKSKAPKKSDAQVVADTKVASELQKGRSYVVQLMVDPRQPTWGGVKDLPTASALIKATFEQLGWRFLMPPTPREPTAVAAQKLAAAQPLEFVFNGTWMRDEKYQTLSPSWVGMALPYPLPTA
jgi:hypothetical protein